MNCRLIRAGAHADELAFSIVSISAGARNVLLTGRNKINHSATAARRFGLHFLLKPFVRPLDG